MTSTDDIQYASMLIDIQLKMPIYFSYTVPWIGLVSSSFALIVLFLSKRSENSLIIYIFKWQYAIGVIYALNLVFLDNTYSQKLFNYSLNINVPVFLCQIEFVVINTIYCLSPWMQVVSLGS